ncbi:Alpha/Beta hydrolase protein [Papiliotrema laurentii]|uniref:Alpha/Beta hydrolase protein n=1 Tax=Papiliotrema laurentii TaxID=5418 RepID=A0AAD9D2X9_PAPLA|nr:Alpha/Beta hydrolase protein [Papiliotrema laurentii]
MSSNGVKVAEEWILGPNNTPFFTTTWSPADAEPKAYLLFVHGFAEHIGRYADFIARLAAEPYNLYVLAFDQRGHGKTSMMPLTASDPQVVKWKEEGKTVKLEKNGKRRTGGWARVMPDLEWFVQHLSKPAKEAGKKLFLWGFSMGGGEVIGFVTRSQSPPSEETVKLVDGVIAGGPLIKLTTPAPGIQVHAGSIAASIGLGSFLIPTQLKYEHLSHNTAANEANKKDPLCEQVGSLRGVADMINLGGLLISSGPLEKFPQDMPLLVYHGEEDKICSPEAAKEFVDKCNAKDKTIHLFKGMYHEVHNELEPTPTDAAKLIGDWVLARAEVTTAANQAKL